MYLYQIMQEPNPRKEIMNTIMSNLRYAANIVGSSLSHPFECAEIDITTGRVARHYKPENDENARSYDLSHNLKAMYLIIKEGILHPTTVSYIDRDTLEVTRE